MQPDHLTYQWLVPQLVGVIGGMILLFLGGITWVVNNTLGAVKLVITEMKDDMKASNAEMKKYFDENQNKHHKTDIRLTRIEEHIPAG